MGNFCSHKDIVHVFTVGGCEIHAGSQQQVKQDGHKFDLVISLTGHGIRKPMPFQMSRGSSRMLSGLHDYKKRKLHSLIIDWPDGSAPDLDLDFWETLSKDLLQMKGRAVIHCFAGHGRTGVALCSLIQVSNYRPALDSGDVIQWVRKHYCGDAVETMSQVDYLRHTMGVVTASQSSRGWVEPRSTQNDERGMSRYFRQPAQEDQHFDLDQIGQLSLEDE